MNAKQDEMKRSLGLSSAIALVVGTIIGTGVFLKAAIMSQFLGSSFWVIIAWIVAGLLSLAGALTYAEIGILFPRAGGEYVYLKEAFGDLSAFLYGWQRFWVSAPGTIAAYAVGAATFAAPLFNMKLFGGQQGFAVFIIIIFSLLNCLNIHVGGRIQNFMTALKVLMIVGIMLGVLFLTEHSFVAQNFSATGGFSYGAFGAALLAALWAYDGWNNMPMVAGEIKDPHRNIPLALGLGVLFILGLYCILHYCYFSALPFVEVANANSKDFPAALPVATKATQTFLGSKGVWLLGVAMTFSALGAMNGSILTNARVPYAMARDGLFFKSLGSLHPQTQSPYVAVLIQAVFSVVLALSGTFDQLTDYVVFASWIFYALVTFSVFVFRKTHANLERPYKTFGYPYIPVIFLVLAVILLVNTLWISPQASLWGLGIILLGVPFYFLQKRFQAAQGQT